MLGLAQNKQPCRKQVLQDSLLVCALPRPCYVHEALSWRSTPLTVSRRSSRTQAKALPHTAVSSNPQVLTL